MKFLTVRLGLLAAGLTFALAVQSQPGGGGGGFGGGGGGGDIGGAGGGAQTPAPEQNNEQAAAERLPGRWEIEFRIEFFSADPEASGKYLEVDAEMFVNGDQVEGRIQEQNVRGEFSCTFDGVERCQFGKMRFQGEDQEWQDFGFVLDRFGGDRATGWAEWINVENGEIQRFELRLRKR
jgi:hypothetical protein